MRSHPTWVRGLKLHNLMWGSLVMSVAPYVGAWIETLWTVEIMMQNPVAPYVGAWIETSTKGKVSIKGNVAPYVGAWIETP